ncbi:microtubule-associated protein futsch-like isoform X2 [Ptychodera flava]|uniref:microtubule-associated protein futsch-like isoform X2 n=1 Tax=Ptychodera flava TaxID=63121 RepID=UPI00396A5777
MAPYYEALTSPSYSTQEWTENMDFNNTTQPMANGNEPALDNSAPSQKYIAIVILVAGVIGGLILVICIIVCCKYCIKKKKPLRRQQAFFKRFPADYQRPPYRPAPKEAEDAQVSRKPRNGLQDSNLSFHEERAEDLEAFPLKNGSYTQLEDPADSNAVPVSAYSPDLSDVPFDDPVLDDSEVSPSSPRRVSFQIKVPTKEPQYNAASRYTEGDFHHLKNARISKTPSTTIITTSMESSHGSVEALGENLYASELSEPEQIDILKHSASSEQDDVELASTPSPTHSMPHTTEVAVQVHHSADELEDELDNRLKSNSAVKAFSTKVAKHISLDNVSGPRKRTWDIPQQAVSLDGDIKQNGGVTLQSYKHATSADLPNFGDTKKHEKPSKKDKSSEEWVQLRGSKETDLRGESDEAEAYKINVIGPPPEIAIEEGTTSPERVERKMITAKDYRELWHLRSTLEQEDSNGSITSEPDTVVPASMSREDLKLSENSQTNHTGIEAEFTYYETTTESGKLKKKVDKQQEPEDKNRLTVQRRRLSKTKDDSLDYAFSSISTEESDTSERSRGGDSSYEKDGTSKLKQMQADSGYASIEQQQRPALTILQKRALYASSDRDSTSIESTSYPSHTSTDISPIKEIPPVGVGAKDKGITSKRRHINKDGRTEVVFRARDDPRTASKKRREFTAEGKSGALYDSFSFPEDESEADSQTSAYESPNDQKPRIKRSDSFGDRVAGRIGRFFRKDRDERYEYSLTKRDYSIDEKTDALFKEFIRQDSMFDDPPQLRGRASISKGRLHLQRKQHSDPLVERKLLEIPHTERSASFEHRRQTLDRDSSREEDYPQRPPRYSDRPRRLVPQDSIEEEYLRQESSRIWEGKVPPQQQKAPSSSTRSSEIRDAKSYYSEKRKEMSVRPKRLLPQESTSDEDYSKGQKPPRPRYFKYPSKGLSLPGPDTSRKSSNRSHPRRQFSVPEIIEQVPHRQDSISEEETPPHSKSRFDFERAMAKEYMKQESISEEDVPSAKSCLEFRQRPLREQSRQESISEEDVPGSSKSRLETPPQLERPHSASSLHRLQRQMTSPETFGPLDSRSSYSPPRSAFRRPEKTKSVDHIRHCSPSRETHYHDISKPSSHDQAFGSKSRYSELYGNTSPAAKRQARLERYNTRDMGHKDKS